MADEIKLTIKSKTENGGYKSEWSFGQINIDQSAVGAASGVQSVATSAEDLVVGDVSTPGYLFLYNLDSTNFVEVGKTVSASFEELVKLQPGEMCCFRVADSTTIRLQADTAACKVQYLLLED